jgi:N-glycosylase/DNA lyase
MFTPSASGLSAMHFLWSHYQGKCSFSPTSSEEWLDEFFFCLLGGYSISFELNKSAFVVLKEKGYFNTQLLWEKELEITAAISSELQTPQFCPRLLNGDFRTYRFPKKKASIIAKAGHWLQEICDFDLEKLLESNADSKQNRDILLACPGLGYKSASWFLRNIGMGSSLAILDIHVYRTLQEFRIIPEGLDISSNYLEIEDIYCHACDLIGAQADIMDLIIWTWSRGGVYAQHKYSI